MYLSSNVPSSMPPATCEATTCVHMYLPSFVTEVTPGDRVLDPAHVMPPRTDNKPDKWPRIVLLDPATGTHPALDRLAALNVGAKVLRALHDARTQWLQDHSP